MNTENTHNRPKPIVAHSRDLISSIDVHKYTLRYSNLGVHQLLRKLHKIEKEIVEDIVKTCISILEKNHADIKGDLFFINKIPYKIYVDFLKNKRTLNIYFYPIRPIKSKSQTSLITINGFGLVKEFELTFPESIAHIVKPLEYILFQQITLAYKSIESVFKTKFRHFGQYLFENLYNIINVEIERFNKPQLLGKIFFAVTLRKSNRFRYFFDTEKLQIIIDYFKANQIFAYSPIELISALISDEAGHTINMLLETQKDKFSSLSSTDFVSVEEDFQFWSSEALFLEYKEISCFLVTKTPKLILQVNCHKELEQELNEVLLNCSDALETQFKSNIKLYMKHANDLAKIPRPNIPSEKRQSIAEFIGTVVGKGSAEFIKSILEP